MYFAGCESTGLRGGRGCFLCQWCHKFVRLPVFCRPSIYCFRQPKCHLVVPEGVHCTKYQSTVEVSTHCQYIEHWSGACVPPVESAVSQESYRGSHLAYIHYGRKVFCEVKDAVQLAGLALPPSNHCGMIKNWQIYSYPLQPWYPVNNLGFSRILCNSSNLFSF